MDDENMSKHADSEWRDTDDEMDDEDVSLYHALSSGDMNVLKQVITGGKSVNTRFNGHNQLHRTLLHLACEKGQFVCASYLLAQGANCRSFDAWFQTPLMYSVGFGYEEITTLILNTPECDVDQRDKYGNSALHLACRSHHLPCMELLLEHGADVDIMDDKGQTPLWQSLSRDGYIEVIKKLLDAGAEFDLIDKRERRTPLQCSIFYPKKDNIIYMTHLLDIGCNTDNIDALEHTPLMTLIRKTKLSGGKVSEHEMEMARTLLKYGADVNQLVCGKHWYQFKGTVLRYIVETCPYLPLIELILCAGANPDIADDYDVTPLLVCAQSNLFEVARLMIASNCKLGVMGQIKKHTPYDGYHYVTFTPFKYCMKYGYWEFAELLVYGGYTLFNESYFWTNKSVPPLLMENFDFWCWLHYHLSHAQSLLALSRKVIQENLRHPRLENMKRLCRAPGILRILRYERLI